MPEQEDTKIEQKAPDPTPEAPAPAVVPETTALTAPVTGQVVQTKTGELTDILSSIINLSASGIYHECSCPFCSNRYRAEAEKVYKSIDFQSKDKDERVSQYFKSVGQNISCDVIRNHVKGHMDKGDNEIKKVEYISKLATLSTSNATTVDQIKLGVSVIMECITSVGSIAPDKNTTFSEAQALKASLVTKLVKAWVDMIEFQHKIYGEDMKKGNVIILPKGGFVKVFDDALVNAKNKQDRALIQSIMTGLENLEQK